MALVHHLPTPLARTHKTGTRLRLATPPRAITMEDKKDKGFIRKRKEGMLAYAKKHPRTLKWLEKRLAKELEVQDEKYKEFNQSPLYRFYSTEAATRVTPSLKYDRYEKVGEPLKFPDSRSTMLVYVVRGMVRAVRYNPKSRTKKKTVRLVTYKQGDYFYRMGMGRARLVSGAENTVVLASRVDAMFEVAMRYRKSETNAVQPPVLVAATLNVVKMLDSIPFFREVVGGKLGDVAQFCKMEIHNGGDIIVKQNEALESFWMLLSGDAEMTIDEDHDGGGAYARGGTTYTGHTSLSLLQTAMERPLEAFLTKRTHLRKKLTAEDIRWEPTPEPWLRTETACKIASFPETELSTQYAFDSRRFRIKSRMISNFADKDSHELNEERRRARGNKRGFGSMFSTDESKLGSPAVMAKLGRRYGSRPVLSPILPRDDQMTRFFKMGMYARMGMVPGVKKTQRAQQQDVSRVPLGPGSHFGSVELCGQSAKVSKFTVQVTDDSVWLRIHKKSFQKFLDFERGIKYKYFRFLNSAGSAQSVQREFSFNLWQQVEAGGNVAGSNQATDDRPKVRSIRQLKYGRDVDENMGGKITA